MSKMIRVTPEYSEECRRELDQYLKSVRLSDGKLTFTKVFNADGRKATVYFSAEAWAKMIMLLQEFDNEVAWHGVAYRMDTDGKDEYLITDILVYPQSVSAATVEMDPEKYAKWLMDNDSDERFYNIHMQGHSHVRMATNPSPTDLSHQEEILAQLGDDSFYIFMIYNKSLNRNIRIYDMRENIMFEDKDVEVRLQDSATGLDEFIRDAKNMVAIKQYNYYNGGAYSGGTYIGGAYGSGAYTGQYSAPAHQPPVSGKSTEPYNPLGASTPVTPASGAVQPATGPNTQSFPDKKKGKEKRKSKIGAGWYGAGADEAQEFITEISGR